MRILITGGAGFIGANLTRCVLENTEHHVLNLDSLCFPGSRVTIDQFERHPRYRFIEASICDYAACREALRSFEPEAVMYLAAESHVDRSIEDPGRFVQSNIIGTYTLLQAVVEYWRQLENQQKANFRFHHISTDEVYGSLGPGDPAFAEVTPYRPTSPYSASKAASDHLVSAWHGTYGLPVVISNCSNNYGPYQFPEKLIPLMILKAQRSEPMPVYGQGKNIRDWLYVEDHAEALLLVLSRGQVGESYNIGGNCEQDNLSLITRLCSILDEMSPADQPYGRLITFVEDRPGHDFRYAVNAEKVAMELGWKPEHDIDSGLRKTVNWYLNNPDWCYRVTCGVYEGQRLGRLSI